MILLLMIVMPVHSQNATPETTPEPLPEIDLLTYYADLNQTRRDDGGFVLGDPAATLTAVVFSNFTCADCIAYAPTVTRFIREFVAEGLARIEYRLFAVTDETSAPYAEIAECAGEQDRFWETRELLFDAWGVIESAAEAAEEAPTSPAATQPPDLEALPLSPNEAVAMLVEALELDAEALEACLTGGEAQQVVTDTLLAVELDVIGAPAVMFRVGDSTPRWLQVQGQVQNRGGLSFEVLELAVEAANR